VKLAVTADLHIDHGHHGRINPGTRRNDAWESVDRCVTAISEHVIDNDVDAFIIAGDPFAHGRPSAEAYEMLADNLRAVTAAGRQVVLIRGNHELISARYHRSAIDRYKDLPGVTVVDEPSIVHLGDLQLVCVPWPRPHVALEGTETRRFTPGELDAITAGWVTDRIAYLADQIDTSRPAVLAGHLSVADAMIGSTRRGTELFVHSVLTEPVIPTEALEDGPWQRVVLGHIHRRQQIGDRIEYVGSPDRIDFTEEGLERAATILETTGDSTISRTDLPTPARELRTIPINDVDAVLATIDNITDGTIVRVELTDRHRRMPPEVTKRLNERGFRWVTRPAPPQAVARTEGVYAATITPLDAATTWLNTQKNSEPAVLEEAFRDLQTLIDR
jgi:DNA repair protein SbcD/Mre11